MSLLSIISKFNLGVEGEGVEKRRCLCLPSERVLALIVYRCVAALYHSIGGKVCWRVAACEGVGAGVDCIGGTGERLGYLIWIDVMSMWQGNLDEGRRSPVPDK